MSGQNLKSFSQLGQDLEVLKFYNNKKNGYFIEMGASDGIELSNTFMLEKDYNWTGMCIEPIPRRYAELVMNRPNSVCCNEVVYGETGTDVVFDIANGYDLFSGISYNIDCHSERVNENIS